LKPGVFFSEPKTSGEHIKKCRLELGLTQPGLSKRLPASQCTGWEKGKSDPLIEDMLRIIEFLGHDPYPLPAHGERIRAKRLGSMRELGCRGNAA
jgi:predicted transcriptional regulator